MTAAIIESFNWLTPEFSILPTDKNVVKIKGVALPPNTVSRNNKKYIDEEMAYAARTWIDAPITINHAPWSDKHNMKGKVNWMEYDPKDGTMEYVGEVWAPPEVAELRVYKENPSASKVRGVSIEADYLHIKCVKCGEKFFSEEEWRSHMEEVELVKDLPLEPHGIRGRALSIVLSPESPGVEGNTLEVMETAPHGLSQLLEIVVTNNKLKEEYRNKMSRIAVSQEQKHIAVGRTTKHKADIIEQEHECPEGEHWDEEAQACVANAVAEQEHECPEGERWSEEQQKCVANVAAEQEVHECPDGEHWSEEEQKCVADAVVEQAELSACPEGQHRNEAGECVPDVAVSETVKFKPAESTTHTLLKEKVKPLKLSEKAPKLSLGEPFGPYDSFEDCVSKNSDKENPEAYCGSVKHEAEGEMYRRKQTTEKINEVIAALNELSVSEAVDNVEWQPIVKKNMDAAEANACSVKALRESLGRIKPYNDKPLLAEIQGLKDVSDSNAESMTNQFKEVKEALAKKDDDLATMRRAVEIADENVKAKDKIAETKRATLEEIKQQSEKRLKETEELTKKLEEQTVRADNAEDKLSKTAEFKGVTKPAVKETKDQADLTYTPDKTKKKEKTR